MKPSEKIEKLAKEFASNEWVNKNSVSNQFRDPEDYLDFLLQKPNFILMIVGDFLDEEWKKNHCEHLNSTPIGGSPGPGHICPQCRLIFCKEHIYD